MRWTMVLGVVLGCGAGEGEPCDAETPCGGGLECVSTVMCTVGPCPGSCRAPCDGDGDCEAPLSCQVPTGWDPEGPQYCIEPG